MQLLLDTHVVVWAILAPHRLTSAVAAILKDDVNELHVSPVSAYELIQKFRSGKWPEAAVLATDFAGEIALAGFEPLPLSLAVMVRAASFTGDHRDPWDRILAAQSLISGFPLLSVDPMIDAFGVDRIWA